MRKPGAGRPHQNTVGKKVPMAFKIRPDIAKWLREQTESQAVLIENALIIAYGIGDDDL